jgi:hypothetical protein
MRRHHRHSFRQSTPPTPPFAKPRYRKSDVNGRELSREESYGENRQRALAATGQQPTRGIFSR